ncbi:hypothetical protein [Streptomyces prasinus]|uniref:hypothetical protein n=1 Tax=Streptomyces prasinus TaxID=67345 RepID=UPI0038230F75
MRWWKRQKARTDTPGLPTDAADGASAEADARHGLANPVTGPVAAVLPGPRSVHAGRDQHLVVTGDRNRISIRGGVLATGRVRVPRSTYELEVRALEAAAFEGREAELEAMARFAIAATPSNSGYWRWLAPAWSGKTVLMARFYLDPPDGVDVLGFFITSRMAGRADRTAFLSALQSQLQAYLGDADLDCTGHGGFQDGLQQAAAQARAAGRHLVLLVDGLDEDTGVTSASTGYSIASLLPRNLPDGLRIIVAGRPNPPVPGDVPDAHPLRDPAIDHPLTESPAARANRHEAERNLTALIAAGGLSRDLIGLTAASGGGLSAADLAHLTGHPRRRIELDLGGSIGRAFQHRPAQWDRDHRGQPVQLYSFAHQELLTGARNLLPRVELDCYRDRIHNYVDQTRQHQWPPTTAEFVLLSYPRLLREHSDTARLTMLATDLVRHERLWKTTGTDTEALTEISDALALHRASSETDLVACVRLAYCRKRLLDKAAMTPNSVIVAWAALGLVHRAVALAVLCREHHRLGVICSGILRAAPDPIHGDLLVAAVSDLPDQASRMAAWQACVSAFALNGRGGKAVDLARAITDPQRQVSALGTIAKAMAGAGRTEETTALLDQAVELARTITNPQQQASALGTISEAMASTGRAEEAVELARTIADPERQAFALSTVTEAMADAGRTEETTALLDQAVELARTITDPQQQASALSAVAKALVNEGRAEETVALLDQAVELTRTITDPQQQASALSTITEAMAGAGRAEEAVALLDQAVELTHTIANPVRQGVTLGTVAKTMAGTGRIEEAVELARTITDPQQQASALAALAEAMAGTGRIKEAVELARTITDPQQQASALAAAAKKRGVTEEGRSLLAEALAFADVVALVGTFPSVAAEALDEAARCLRQDA